MARFLNKIYSMKKGQRLNNGRYLIVNKLGQGGMGAVYLCRDNNLNRNVAIKENVDSSQVAQNQFNQEAVILARLSHSGLPKVMDYFTEPSGYQYLVMEYIAGKDLKEILRERRNPLPEKQAVEWMSQVLEAVRYMHNWVDPDTRRPMPIVHRDIKPANIRLRPDEKLILVDFGIAKLQSVGRTMTGG